MTSHFSSSGNPIGEPADACSVCMNRRDEHEGQDHQFVYGAADEPNPSDPVDLNELEALAKAATDYTPRSHVSHAEAFMDFKMKVSPEAVSHLVARLRQADEELRVGGVEMKALVDELRAAGAEVVSLREALAAAHHETDATIGLLRSTQESGLSILAQRDAAREALATAEAEAAYLRDLLHRLDDAVGL